MTTGDSMRVLVDYHHSSLLRSLIHLFEDRLGMAVYRPIGLEWYTSGNWKVWDHIDTANQYLSLDQGFKPSDGTPQLNQLNGEGIEDGVYMCMDPGTPSRPTRACTLNYFLDRKWDYVVASIPQHIEPFSRLAEKTGAKLIVQAGNEWPSHLWRGVNLMASLAPRPTPAKASIFYHQEFDLRPFKYITPPSTRQSPVHGGSRWVIRSYINCIQQSGGWRDFVELERELEGCSFASFGGQCRDGAVDGLAEMGVSMSECDMVFHVKPGGDGYGHVLHNAFLAGRPVITRRSHYRGQWGERLLTDETCVDLDRFRDKVDAVYEIASILMDRERLLAMSRAAHRRFHEVVDFDREADEIRQWLKELA